MAPNRLFHVQQQPIVANGIVVPDGTKLLVDAAAQKLNLRPFFGSW
jgi:hypothetical protein